MEVGEKSLSRFFSVTLPLLDERERRSMAAVVELLGPGSQALVSRAKCRRAQHSAITSAAQYHVQHAFEDGNDKRAGR